MLNRTRLFAGFIAATAITTVCAHIATTQDPQAPFIPKGYNPTKTMVSVGQPWEVFSGLSYIHYPSGTRNQSFQVSSTETDSLIQSGQTGAVGFNFGFSRVMLFENTSKTSMRGIAFGLLFHCAPEKFSGQVLQSLYTTNSFSYTYEAMPLDFADEVDLYFMQIYAIHAMPFVVIGGGFTATNVTFRETILPTANINVLPSNAQSFRGWVTRPLGIVGGGLEFELSQDWFLKTQYLYHYRGIARLRGGTFANGVPVNLNEQSVDVVAGYRF